ncbi:MAG: sensor histidine kinase [Planctomycetota bacterium]|nr:MAG: sensor histidine kinase [Planctomycetota bacterium]REJ88062.1 MAG: sensor histidine kinase [Planctomycetota bacterium]REK24191.1 MAG: sensor histidine kinase [Planctomycetota bacterium]REK28821.1 MAG: sensor histidine kinase [Planctomycetota bacterium]
MRRKHSIRRKMVAGLCFVLLMLAALAVSSISGVYSYRGMVKDLELGLQEAPRSSELIAAIGLLIKPLALEFPADAAEKDRQRFADHQRVRLETAVEESRARIREFQRRMQRMPHSANYLAQEELVHGALFKDLDDKLRLIEEAAPALGDLDRRAKQPEYIISLTAEMLDSAEELPDPSRELLDRLDQARTNYRWHLAVVWVAGIATLVLLLNLVRCAQRWIIRPVRELHQGARRVADGDFDYRLRVRTDDEMAELAADFNRMTQRFQSIRNDLDRQVKERVKQLIRSERLAGLGFLSAGVAHEINNPLSAIAMAAESLEYRVQDWLPNAEGEDAEEVREYLQMIQNEAQRCRQITEKLLDFARGQAGERNLYDVTAIVREVVSMTRHLGRFRDRTIDVQRESPSYAWVNGPEIKQVVLNLVANALESTSEGGHLEITIEEHPDEVVLAFTDDGSGMTPDVIAHLFEPFFTTREVGKGTGLGLSISQRIVRDHDGVLEAESDGPGRGSTFRLRLPTGQAAADQIAA